MFGKKDNIVIEKKRTEENLLGNKVLLKYKYIIEDDKVNRRFLKFEEWLKEEKIVIFEDLRYGTMRYFKEILHIEESIVNEENRNKIRKFQKSITYW